MDSNENIKNGGGNSLELNIINNNNNNSDNDNNNNSTEEHIESVEQSIKEFNNVANELETEFKDYLVETHKNDVNNIKNDIEAPPSGEFEPGGGDEDEDFKLRNYFKQSKVDAIQNGGKLKKMGVSFKNLTVIGKGADQSVVSDLATPFTFLISKLNFKNWFKKSKPSTFDILHDVSGFCKDGEMLLVLGRPGSGCSSLLRTISNQTGSYVDVLGSVTYGGIDQKKWDKYKAECIYVPEEDTHYPTLTVRETLEFALKCKTPSNRLPNEKKRTFRSKIFNLLLGMFGMVHQAETMVGNEYVRGLSGGERKRITIAESMVSASSINCYDCSTRGLDAASALDYAKSIRIMSDTLHKTTIASFYQASDSIYNLFDRVLILEKGRCVYFGPVGLAKQYFIDMGFECEPRKSTPDFLTGVTNPQERKVRSGFTVPESSAEFEEAWKQSEIYAQSCQEQREYEKLIEIEQPSVDFIQEITEQKSKSTSKSSPYTTGFFVQVIALTIRNFQIIWGDKFSLISRYSSVLVQAPIYGSVFFAMSNSIDGAFTRGGAIFSSILFNALLSEQELGISFTGRRILQKHKTYAMYRPAALHFAQIITEIPIIMIQVFLFSIVTYFMFGLDSSGSKFFINCFTLIGFTLATNNLYRLAGNLTPSVYIGQNIMNVLFLTMMTFTSYIIPYNQMPVWFSWYHYCNPFSFAFRALMGNEFNGLKFDCIEDAIPKGEFYQNETFTPYRSCATTAAEPGQLYFTGENYLEKSFGWEIKPSTQGFIAYNICIVYGFWILFIICNCIVINIIDWTSGGFTCKVYLKGKAPKMNDVENEKQQNLLVQQATNNMKESLSMPGGLFTWQHMYYSVPIGGNTMKLLLDDIQGWIKPGQMTALMGSSGAGKTTLLDVLAKRKTTGQVQGTTLLNGKPLEIDFERITGYVEQMDVLNPALTVRETLRFSAKLRCEPTISLEEKFKYVEQVLEMMEMKHLGDALIGDLETGVGISVEERKRTTIGVELVAKPHILFLDEPTSGLDAQSSYNIIKFIRKLADAGMPLVCTIHQPSSVLFEHFDRILLLAKGGKTVYFGDIGERSKTLTSYFQRHGVRECSDSENPAEYILEACGAGRHGKSVVDWPQAWKESSEYQSICQELKELQVTGSSYASIHVDNGKPREYATSLTYQTIEVYKRLNLIWWRSPGYSYGTFIQSALVGLINGWTFYNLQDSANDMNQRIFFIFNVTMLGILLMFLVLPQFITQQDYFKRDYASKFYHWLPFALSIIVVELPFVLVSGTIFFFCSFWTAGLNSDDASTNFFFWLIFMLFLFYCVGFGQAIGAVCINITVALNLLPVLIIFLFLFCGVLVIPDEIPHFWKWVYHLNPCTHFLEAMVTNVLKHVNVVCTTDDLIKFVKPSSFSTCSDYAFEFLNGSNHSVSGSVQSLGGDNCGYCLYKNGEEYYSKLGWSYDNRWRGFGIIAGYFVLNIFLVVLFVFLTRKGKR
ncbi:hypothetical protein ACTFIW_000745 [Dictyostelium discoideum]